MPLLVRLSLYLAISLTIFTGVVTGQMYNTHLSEYAFTGITVVDVETGKLRTDQVVLVKNGRIEAVGSRKDVRVPLAARVIDGRGRYLAPGFADMHVHLYTEGDLFTYLANGITTVRNMAGDQSHLAFKRRVAAGEIDGPRVITAGPVIETKLSHPDNALVSTAEEARREVRRQKDAGYDFIKIYNDITPEVYKGVMDASRELGMPVAGHVPYTIGIRGALDGRVTSIEHLRGYLHRLLPKSKSLESRPDFRKFTVAWNDAGPANMDKLARETVKAGVWNCPTFAFTVHEMSPEREHRKLVARPETAWLSLSGMPSDRSKGYLEGFGEKGFAAAQNGLVNQFRLLRALDRAGAGLLVGTDSWLSGYAFADELELLVKAGLSPRRVMRMATLDAAKFLNEDADRGSIRPGKIADLVMLEADPFRDIGNTRKVAGVMSSGRYHDRTSIDQMIDKLKKAKTKKP